jgi:hypothetical protein
VRATIERLGDRLLELVVPHRTARAADRCNCVIPCCARVSMGRIEAGWRYEDCIAGVNCSPCYTNGSVC